MRKACAVSDLALIILAALDVSFAHDGISMFRRFTRRASMCTSWRDSRHPLVARAGGWPTPCGVCKGWGFRAADVAG